jgi:hypothetical protein
MYTLPDASTATPRGPCNFELVAVPAVGAPALPVPAKIESVPDGVTFSMTLLLVSAMYKLPDASTATSTGLWNAELVAGPAVGVPDEPDPATIDRVLEPPEALAALLKLVTDTKAAAKNALADAMYLNVRVMVFSISGKGNCTKSTDWAGWHSPSIDFV